MEHTGIDADTDMLEEYLDGDDEEVNVLGLEGENESDAEDSDEDDEEESPNLLQNYWRTLTDYHQPQGFSTSKPTAQMSWYPTQIQNANTTIAPPSSSESESSQIETLAQKIARDQQETSNVSEEDCFGFFSPEAETSQGFGQQLSQA